MTWVWRAVLTVIALVVALLCRVEYVGLTDGKPGGTISEWTFASVPAAVVWLTLVVLGGALGWHFTKGEGRRWPWQRKVSGNDDPGDTP